MTIRRKELVVIAISVLVVIAIIVFLYIREPPEEKPENEIPTVNMDASTSSGTAPLTIFFTCTATDPDGEIATYLWDFGDGETSTEENPVHTYYATGQLERETFEAEVTVTDDMGDMATDNIEITILLDTDYDDIPDINDIDDDNDGYLDNEDYIPKSNAKIKITLKKFKVIDEVDDSPNNLHAQVFFKLYIDEGYKSRIPSEVDSFYDVEIGELKTLDGTYIFDCPDDIDTYEILIQMYDEDGDGIFEDDDLLDIDGSGNSKGLTVEYNIVNETWTGDNTDGITNGSDDGSQDSDDDDCYLEYEIETI